MTNYGQIFSQNSTTENNFASYDESELIDLTKSPLSLSRSSSVIDLTELSYPSQSSSMSPKIIENGFHPVSSDELASPSVMSSASLSYDFYSNNDDIAENTPQIVNCSSSPFPTITITAAVAAIVTIDEDYLIGQRIQEEIISDFLDQYMYEIEVENITYGHLGG